MVTPQEVFQKSAETLAPGCLVQVYLLASLAYHQHDTSLIPDHLFDRVCQELDRRWDEVTHRHKHLIHRGWLRSGTGHPLVSQRLPSIVYGALGLLLCT